jgi:Tfp pilus assembly protein PilX
MPKIQQSTSERGSTLVLLIGVVAVLAVLAATAVMVTANTQKATAGNRTQVQAFNVAEAGLDSALAGVGSEWPATAGSTFTDDALLGAFEVAFPESDYPDPATRPTVTVVAYDDLDPINTSIQWDSNGNGKMWVQSRGELGPKVATVRAQIERKVTATNALFPGVAVYSGGNIGPGSGSWMVTGPVDPATGDPLSAVYAVGSMTRPWNTTLSTVDLVLGGSDTWRNVTTPHGDDVPSLDEVFPPSLVQSITAQAQNAANPSATVLNPIPNWTGPSVTYNAVGDLRVNGNLTLGGGPSTFNFKSLYVTGNVTFEGNTTVSCTALYVGGKLTIGGGSTSISMGPTYVAGVNPSTGIPYEDTSTSSPARSAVIFGGDHHFDVSLLVTPGQVYFSGSQLVGTATNPSLIMMIDDGDATSLDWKYGANGVFTGVPVNLHGGFDLPGGNGSHTDIVGSLFSKGDVDFGGNTGIVYDPDVLNNIHVTTTTPVTQIVPGTWQELPAN